MAERAGQPDFYADPKAASKLLREQKRLEPIVTACAACWMRAVWTRS